MLLATLLLAFNWTTNASDRGFRWGLMASDPPLWATAILQCLHAMSFGAAHLAAIHS
jgi:hypothetical protein